MFVMQALAGQKTHHVLLSNNCSGKQPVSEPQAAAAAVVASWLISSRAEPLSRGDAAQLCS